jgi:hypothetical protein
MKTETGGIPKQQRLTGRVLRVCSLRSQLVASFDSARGNSSATTNGGRGEGRDGENEGQEEADAALPDERRAERWSPRTCLLLRPALLVGRSLQCKRIEIRSAESTATNELAQRRLEEMEI